MTYGPCVAGGALVPPDLKTVMLKDPKNFTIVGQLHGGVDSPKVVTGKPMFGIDVTCRACSTPSSTSARCSAARW